jgi:phospholipase C
MAIIALFALTACGGSEAATATDDVISSAIKHVVVVVQENHSFDSYFGTYCTAPAGSAPTCTGGSGCCEAAPATEPGGASPVQLTDAANAAYSPDHSRACETLEVNGGAMNHFVSGSGSCGQAGNFALASDADAATYRSWAQQYAIADRYFQPILGASSSNDMYLSTTTMMFIDNAYMPRAMGASCASSSPQVQYSGGSIGDLLSARGVSWAWYIEGYASAKAAGSSCAPVPADCPAQAGGYPCTYDPSDIPAAYFKGSVDNPLHMRDFAQLQSDLNAGKLPSVVFVKGLGYHTEHPGSGVTISAGEDFVASVFNAIQRSVHAPTTLMLVTWDESGGYFDHVAPPSTRAGWQPYGARVPLLALGPFARKNFVSHVTMEHSSIVRFIEWNWLGKTGLLHQRDGSVNNIGSLLDPSATKVDVP